MADIVLVTNAEAGSHDAEVIDAVVEVLRRAGNVERVAPDDDAGDSRATVSILESRPDLIVVAGGDGSVHHFVAAVDELGLEVPDLAVIPLGTGNDLARSLGLDPDDPVDAAETAVSGMAAPVDLVRRDGGVVVNAAHAGLGAVASQAASDLKERLGALAYPVGAVIAAVRADGWDLSVEVDGETVADGTVLMAGVGNGRTIGGGTALFPDAELDDGMLEVVVATDTSLSGRAAFGAALQRGEHVTRDDVVTARGKEVVIRGEPVAHNCDGEIGEPLDQQRYRIVPGALSIVRGTRA